MCSTRKIDMRVAERCIINNRVYIYINFLLQNAVLVVHDSSACRGQGSDFDGPLYDVASPLSHQSSNTSSMAVNIDRSELAAGSHKSLSVGRTDKSAVPPGSVQGDSVEKREGASSLSSKALSSPPPKESLI